MPASRPWRTEDLLAAICTLALLLGTACSSEMRSGPAGPWPYSEAAMKVHSLTFARTSESGTELVLHIEFSDAEGDPCKATGQLQLTCSTSGSEIANETIDLSDWLVNKRVYQRSTETYRLILSTGPLAAGTQVVVSAKLKDGSVSLSASRTIPAPPR